MSTKVAEKTDLDLHAFIDEEYGAVVGAVGLITGNRQDAPDAVQDAIVGYISRPPVHQVNNLAAWITVAASNRLRNHHRHQEAESRALQKVGIVTDVNPDPTVTLDHDVRLALMSLPIRQRQVCVLHYLMDQSVETIAEGLDVSVGTVKTQLHRARTTLAKQLRKEDHRG